MDPNLNDANIIDASPTKAFFINMITRDLRLSRAILDLIDNSVDAAYVTQRRLSELEIKVICKPDFFEIKDNCGGIKLQDAKDYAFKFGREEERVTPNSVGQFGVGMKRTLFKLGRKFTVESFKDHSFSINVDVKEWIKNSNWFFEFNENIENVSKGETYIYSYDLFEESIDAFSNPSFLSDLKSQIESAHFKAINKGLKIYLNDILLDRKEIKIYNSEYIKPIKIEYNFEGVDIIISAGIAERDLHRGGWYIICNGRLIEEAEQTSKTGWSNGLPAYHPDYAFFRGIVEFKAENSYKLPWTTTKTGVDADHKVYRFALNEMRKIIKPILSTLKDRVKEEEYASSRLINKSTISEAIKLSSLEVYENIESNKVFKAPKLKRISNPLTTISYKVSNEDLNRVKESYGGDYSNKDIGLKTFKYYLENECD